MALPQELTDPLGASQSKVTIKTVSAELWLGNDTGNTPLQICIFETATPLAEGKLKDLWIARHDGRAYPLILAAVCGTNVTMAGPILRGNDQPSHGVRPYPKAGVTRFEYLRRF